LGTAVVIGEDAVEDFENFSDLDVEGGFFQHFTSDAVAELLAEFKDASRDGPLSFERLGIAAYQQSAFVGNDDGSDADDGVLRVVALHGAR